MPRCVHVLVQMPAAQVFIGKQCRLRQYNKKYGRCHTWAPETRLLLALMPATAQ